MLDIITQWSILRCVTGSEFASNFDKWKKNTLGLFVMLTFDTQLVFTCSRSGMQALEQVVKYAQSLYY